MASKMIYGFSGVSRPLSPFTMDKIREEQFLSRKTRNTEQEEKQENFEETIEESRSLKEDFDILTEAVQEGDLFCYITREGTEQTPQNIYRGIFELANEEEPRILQPVVSFEEENLRDVHVFVIMVAKNLYLVAEQRGIEFVEVRKNTVFSFLSGREKHSVLFRAQRFIQGSLCCLTFNKTMGRIRCFGDGKPLYYKNQSRPMFLTEFVESLLGPFHSCISHEERENILIVTDIDRNEVREKIRLNFDLTKLNLKKKLSIVSEFERYL